MLRITVLGFFCPVALRAEASSGADAAANAAGDTTVYYDVQVFTAEPDHPYAEAVAIRGERILAVGAQAAVEAAAGPGARRVDTAQPYVDS